VKTEPPLLITIVFLLFTRIIRHKTLEIYTIVEAESWMLGSQALLASRGCFKQLELSQIFKGHPQQFGYSLPLQSFAFNRETVEVYFSGNIGQLDKVGITYYN